MHASVCVSVRGVCMYVHVCVHQHACVSVCTCVGDSHVRVTSCVFRFDRNSTHVVLLQVEQQAFLWVLTSLGHHQ